MYKKGIYEVEGELLNSRKSSSDSKVLKKATGGSVRRKDKVDRIVGGMESEMAPSKRRGAKIFGRRLASDMAKDRVPKRRGGKLGKTINTVGDLAVDAAGLVVPGIAGKAINKFGKKAIRGATKFFGLKKGGGVRGFVEDAIEEFSPYVKKGAKRLGQMADENMPGMMKLARKGRKAVKKYTGLACGGAAKARKY